MYDGKENSNTSELVTTVRDRAKRLMSNARSSHAWDHTLRVVKLSKLIAEKEEADEVVLEIAVLLHDIGRASQDASGGTICHAEEGAETAKKIIKDLPLSIDQKENIIHCIISHRFRGNKVPGTREAKILFDADKLDSIGAVGIARTYLFAGEVGASLHNKNIENIEQTKPYSQDDTGFREYSVKLKKVKDKMLTQEGIRLAESRHAFMEDFFNQFIEEHEGKR